MLTYFLHSLKTIAGRLADDEYLKQQVAVLKRMCTLEQQDAAEQSQG